MKYIYLFWTKKTLILGKVCLDSWGFMWVWYILIYVLELVLSGRLIMPNICTL